MQTQNVQTTTPDRLRRNANIASRYSTSNITICTNDLQDLYKLFFSNNNYLLKKRGKSFYRQIKDFKELYNIRLYNNTIKRLIRGETNYISFVFLHHFAQYHNVKVWEMLSRDMSLDAPEEEGK